jgi:RNA polymerase sigma factor (sigma-70 family)
MGTGHHEREVARILGDPIEETYWRPGDPHPEPRSCNGAFWYWRRPRRDRRGGILRPLRGGVLHRRHQLAWILGGGEHPGHASEGLGAFRRRLAKIDPRGWEWSEPEPEHQQRRWFGEVRREPTTWWGRHRKRRRRDRFPRHWWAKWHLRLARRYERGDLEAKAQLIRAHLPLAISMARKRIHGQGRDLDNSYEDLIQAAALGLDRAALKFDYRKGFKFPTCATWWIRKALQDTEADQRPIPLRNDAAKAMGKLLRAGGKIRAAYGRTATIPELVDATGIDEAEVHALKGAMEIPESLDRGLELDEDTVPVAETIASDAPAPRAEYDLEPLLSVLTERERQVVDHRLGLDDPPSYAETAALLGISKTHVWRLEAQAKEKLRKQPRPRRIVREVDEKLGVHLDELAHIMESDSDGLPYQSRQVKRWPLLRTREASDPSIYDGQGEYRPVASWVPLENRRGMFVPKWERPAEVVPMPTVSRRELGDAA